MPSVFATAHRGDSSRFRENTLVAIQSAIEAGAQIIEIDVRLAKDGQVVVLHDPTLERLWGVSAPVNEQTWDQIRFMGEPDVRIPLLSEVLSLFVGSSSTIMIDMEEADPAVAAYGVVQNSSLSQLQVRWCGNVEAMRQIRDLSPAALIWMPWNEIAMPSKADISSLLPEFINLHYSFLSRKRVEMFHEMGYKVAAWTVDDEATMRWAISIGVDSITTNQLSMLQGILREGSPKESPREASIDEIDLDKAMLIARDLGKWAIMVASSMDPGEISLKQNPADIVTEIDVLIEAHVREVIAANFPGHNFVGEEMGGNFVPDTPSWYLDPIDGTTNFANRMPWTSMSLALAFNRTPLVAVVIDPWRNSLFEARAGKGAKLNGREIHVENQTGVKNPLSSRIVATELAAYQPWPGMLQLLQALADNFCTMRIMGSGTLTLVGVSVARGVGAVIGHYSPIDHLAAVLIVHEAGGAVLDETGEVNLFPKREAFYVLPKPRRNLFMIFGRKRSPSYVASFSHVLAIDLGGSKVSGAIIDSNLSLLIQRTVPSRQTIQGIADPELLETKRLIIDLCAEAESNGIDLGYGGAGFPEYVNLEGVLTSADNIDWKVQPQEEFAFITGFPWLAQSDVRCAGIAEAQRGAGRGISDFVYVTISSGISHTHFLDGRAVTGSHGEAIGFGLIEVEISGKSYVLENYCSGLGIARRYADEIVGHSFDAKSLMERFEFDFEARRIINTACEVLGGELAKLARELSTSVIVIGGGLWLGSQKYRELVLDSFEDFCKTLGIHPSILNAEVEHAGVVGAAIYALAELA